MRNRNIWIILGSTLCWFILWSILRGGPVMFADALRGLETLRYSELLGTFNHLYYPNPHRPDDLEQLFVSWWTPGQYQWLSLWLRIFPNISTATFAAAFVAYLTGVLGWIRLWKRKNSPVPLVVIALLLFNRNTYWFILMYMGGDVLLFAVLPFFIHALIWQKNIWRWLPLWVLLGLWAKASFIVIAIPAIAIRFWPQRYRCRTYLQILPTVAAAVLAYILYFQQGSTPTNTIDLEGYVNLPHSRWNGWLYALSAPISTNLWGWSTVELLWKGSLINEIVVYVLFGIMVLCTALLVRHLSLRSLYAKLTLGIWVFFAVFFAVQQMMMSAISFEVRHFVPVGLLFLPLIWETLKKRVGSRSFTVIFSIVILVGFVDVLRFPLIKKQIADAHTAHHTLPLPFETPQLNLEKNTLLVTDVWTYLCAYPELTHKLAVERLPSDSQSVTFQVVHGIESSFRPVFSMLGKSERNLVAVFFTLTEDDILQLMAKRNVIIEDCGDHYLVRELGI